MSASADSAAASCGSRSVVAALATTRAFRLTLALHALLGVGLTVAPLLDGLGFERALASALLAALTSPALSIAAVRTARRAGGEPLAWWGASVALGVLTLGPSFLVGLLKESLTLACDVEQGALFFLLLGGGNVLVGSSFGFLTACAFPGERLEGGLRPPSSRGEADPLSSSDVSASARPPRTARSAVGDPPGAHDPLGGDLVAPRWPWLDRGRSAAPMLAVVAIDATWLARALFRLYREPQIFLYVTPLGFWPGSLYDEALAVDLALWAFRGFGALLALGLVLLARAFLDPRTLRFRPRSSAPSAAALGAFALGLAAWLHTSAGHLGFDLDRGDIRRALSRTLTTEHFVIYADPSIDTRSLEALAREHELVYQQLTRFFGQSPEGRIQTFVYRDAAQKGALMGAEHTQIARPWVREAHIHGAEVPHRVLRHELAHLFAGELADPPFRIPLLFGIVPNIGLIEGLAVAADWPTRELTVHQWAAAMQRLDVLPVLSKSLDPAGFWGISSARAYTATGSFVRWLIDEHGIEPFGKVYRGEGFQAGYGRSAAELEAGWRAYLEGIPLSPAALRMAEHRFARPSIFQKTCARAAASLSEEAYQGMSTGDLERARQLVERLYRYQPSNPAPLVALGRAYLREGDLERAEILAERAQAAPGATERARAEGLELEGEVAWKRGRLEAAREHFQAVRALSLSTASERLQTVRLAALDEPPEAREALRAYLSGELPAGVDLVRLGNLARASEDDPIAPYLYARRLEAVGAFSEGLVQLERAEALPTTALAVEAEMTRGRLAFRAGRYLDAARIFEALATRVERPVHRAEAADWAERAHHAARWNRGSTPSRFGG